MTATFVVAEDEMRDVLNVAWEAGSAAYCDYVPVIRWPGKEESKPEGNEYWGRFSSQVVDEVQSAFGAEGCIKHEISGLVFFQLFCPKSVADSYEKGQLLAMLVRNAYRGKKTANGVWFRNARINPLTGEELWHRFNVVAEYQYDEVR